jgi:hypothetical protein
MSLVWVLAEGAEYEDALNILGIFKSKTKALKQFNFLVESRKYKLLQNNLGHYFAYNVPSGTLYLSLDSYDLDEEEI